MSQFGVIWGSTENSCRIGIQFQDLPTITPDTASITLGANLWFSSSVPVTDNTNTTYWDWLGYGSDPDGSDTEALKLTAYHGEKSFKSVSRSMPLYYGSPTIVNLNAWVNQLGFVTDGQLDVSAAISLSRPYQLPRPPVNPTVTRNSDTSHTVTWGTDYTNNAGGYPWTGVKVWRWDNASNQWGALADLSYSVTSYTDATTVSDRKYRYAVVAGNDSGWSSYAYTDYSLTTPAAHTNLQWARATSDVVLTWVKASTLDVQTEVQESANGGAYATLATVAAGTNTWTHSAPSGARTHQYRVRPSLSGAPASSWVTSTVVPVLLAPLAPTALTPNGVTVDPGDGSVAVTWQHNPADGTSQTAYEHQVKESGGSYTSSGKITSASSGRSLATLVRGKTYVHQVRTYSQSATASPWSAEQSFTTGARPVAGVTYPTAADHGMSSLTMAWSYYDLEGGVQTNSQVELKQGAAVVYSATLPGAVTSHLLAYTLANNATYTARVRVLDASGLWSSWAEQTFSTVFVPPTTPTVTGAFNADLGIVTLTITNPGADGTTTVKPVSNVVYRSIGGVEEEISTLGINTTFIDQVPTSSGTNTYRVVAWSATPTSADSAPLDLVCYSPWLFVNGGPDNSTMARLKGGPAVTLTAGRPKVLHQFVGAQFPLEFTGTARERAYKISGAVDGFGVELDAWGSWEAWEAIADLPAPLVFRDPLGRREYVSISDVGIDHDATSKKAKVSATLTVVDRG